MTEHPGNLAAWLDDELDNAESERITRHVEACADCRARARAFAEVTAALPGLEFAPPSTRRWRVAAAWAGGIAAGVLLAVALWPHRETPAIAHVPPTPEVVTPAPVRMTTPPAPVLHPARHRRRSPAPARQAPPYAGAIVRVAFPADALFAPGAVPAGATIYADLLLAADGSARELRLLP